MGTGVEECIRGARWKLREAVKGARRRARTHTHAPSLNNKHALLHGLDLECIQGGGVEGRMQVIMSIVGHAWQRPRGDKLVERLVGGLVCT